MIKLSGTTSNNKAYKDQLQYVIRLIKQRNCKPTQTWPRTDKMVAEKTVTGQNGTEKMVWTEWYSLRTKR